MDFEGVQELTDSVQRRVSACPTVVAGRSGVSARLLTGVSSRSFQSEALGTNSALEVQFQRALQNARCCGADGASERGTADVPVHRAWPIKLGVIEDVEAFYAEQQRL
jgi:hypothetical protein